MIGAFFLAWINSQAAIVALVGSRVSPQASATKDAYPKITYFRVGEGRVSSLRGPSGLTTPRLQIEIHSRSYSEVQAIAKLIKGHKVAGSSPTGLDGYRGTLGGVTVQAAIFNDQRDDYDEPATATQFGVHRAVLDFTIWHEE